MASIVKRPTADGQARYLVRYRDPAGKVRNRTFKRHDDATKFVRTVEADLLRGQWVDPEAGRLTLTKYADRWVHERPGLRPRTVELYRGQLARHILPTLGDLELNKLTTATVRTWHADLTRADKPGPVTVAKCYRLLRAILNTAAEDDLIIKNPCSLKGAGVERSPERPIATPEQVWALADAIEPRFRLMVLSAAFLGLRFGELAGLSRRHVNVLHRTVTVERQLVQLESGATEFGPPKTDKGCRTIAIPPQLLPELEHHLATYAGPGPDGLVFVGSKGAALHRSNWHPKWDEARTAVGLTSAFHFHDLRHTSNTLAAATGASTRELMHRMGHASPAAALRYQHATAERDAVIADALGEALERRRRTG